MNKAKGTYSKPSGRPGSTLSPKHMREKGPENLFKKNNGWKSPKASVGNGHPHQRIQRKLKRGIYRNSHLDTL